MTEHRYGLTERGRVAALAVRLRTDRPLVARGVAAIAENWPQLTPEQRAEAMALVERLSAAARQPRRTVRVPLIGRAAV